MSNVKSQLALAVRIVSLVAIGAVVASTPVSAAPSGEDTYLIMSPHTKESCLADLDAVLAETPQLLDSIEWGCMSGDHTGYLIVQAKSEDAARQMLPTSLRKDAKIIRLNQFSADQIRSFHKG
jgi:hypothetical protein